MSNLQSIDNWQHILDLHAGDAEGDNATSILRDHDGWLWHCTWRRHSANGMNDGSAVLTRLGSGTFPYSILEHLWEQLLCPEDLLRLPYVELVKYVPNEHLQQWRLQLEQEGRLDPAGSDLAAAI